MKWEYKIVRYDRRPRILFKLDELAIEDKINLMSADGWEVVSFSIQQSFFGREDSALVVFRRDKQFK